MVSFVLCILNSTFITAAVYVVYAHGCALVKTSIEQVKEMHKIDELMVNQKIKLTPLELDFHQK